MIEIRCNKPRKAARMAVRRAQQAGDKVTVHIQGRTWGTDHDVVLRDVGPGDSVEAVERRIRELW